MMSMKRRIALKLSSKTGESIAETLVALLISALALLMLAGAITASTRVITRSKEKMTEYYAANEAVEMQPPGDVANPIPTLSVIRVDAHTFHLDNVAAMNSTGTVNYYVNNTIGGVPVISYALQ